MSGSGSVTGLSKTTTNTSGEIISAIDTGTYSLGTIDPSLYKISDDDDIYEISSSHLGRMWFAVEYEREGERLLVTLIKAKNLPNRQPGVENSCDPFVRLCVVPDERRYLQSKPKKKTCNPQFEEKYVFQISQRSMEERMLKLTVYDVDRYKRNRIIGHALYSLQGHDSLSNERLVIWRDLERDVTECAASSTGELMVSLCYNNHLERLTVGIYDGRLHKAATNPPQDTYVKVRMSFQNKALKTKRSCVAKKTNQPFFNESFVFKVPTSDLNAASVSLVLLQHASGHKEKQAGRIVLGSYMFARGKELDHWNDMVANPMEQFQRQHILS